MPKRWEGRGVLVTGGASFIGSHLVDALIERGGCVRVVDDLSSGDLANLAAHQGSSRLEFVKADLREPAVARSAVDGVDVVFHLAADHGGRGYVDRHQAGPASNLFLDGVVFSEALRAGTDQVIFASSGCVYPNYLQEDPAQVLYLREDMVGPPYDADNMYGYAKLMGELTLQAYAREHGLKAASCRYFTAYGPRANETHAVMAMIARAFVRKDPFEVWGTGEQIRNWTYVDDIVTGTILVAERVTDGSAVNLGTMERVRVMDAARMILDLLGHSSDIATRPDMPTGPLNRVADNRHARELLGWEPSVQFSQGVRRTIEWYTQSKDRDGVASVLEAGGLEARKVQAVR
jgi:nucleoside-diphosphate-sugar epimerase